ncbi:MAG: TraR/DksA C4-type zinc finger protein [Nitriliruptorales bacterium]|nr:TraR/DksA C4-type zinc finger protein [Nitriliruptorales bacterium]
MATPKKLTKAVLAKHREALEAERSELLSQIDELDAEADVKNWRDGGFDDDPADSGSANIERERAQSLARHARGMLDQIDAAIDRIEDGSYGTCTRCGKPVERARLNALPYAELCVSCKQLDEAGR